MSNHSELSLSRAADESGSGKAVRWAENVVTWGALAAGYALLFQAVFTVAEILARKLFNHSFQGVDELGGYGLAITASLGFGLATLQRAHTRVDILLRLLPTRMRGYLHIVALTVLFAISLAMLWYAHIAIADSLRYGSISNTPLQTPLWIPQGLWIAGFVVFALSAGIMTIRAYVLLFRGDFDNLDREFGPPTVDEEIESSMD